MDPAIPSLAVIIVWLVLIYFKLVEIKRLLEEIKKKR